MKYCQIDAANYPYIRLESVVFKKELTKILNQLTENGIPLNSEWAYNDIVNHFLKQLKDDGYIEVK